jgi:hypothetical protein
VAGGRQRARGNTRDPQQRVQHPKQKCKQGPQTHPTEDRRPQEKQQQQRKKRRRKNIDTHQSAHDKVFRATTGKVVTKVELRGGKVIDEYTKQLVGPNTRDQTWAKCVWY